MIGGSGRTDFLYLTILEFLSYSLPTLCRSETKTGPISQRVLIVTISDRP